MNQSLKKIASLVNGKIIGDDSLIISGVARIDEAKKGELTFLYLSMFEKYFETTKASAIIVKPGFNKTRDDITYIEAEAPDKAFGKIIINYLSPSFPLEGIDETAFVHNSAVTGKNVALGKNVVVSAGCRIGDNVKIFHNTVLSDNVVIGDDSLIFQNRSEEHTSELQSH